MNALISLKPSESEMKSLISAIDSVLPLEPYGAEAFGAPSKKNSTGTCRIWDICCNRLAPMRLAALSYFCTCWKERPSAAPSFSWLIASILRRSEKPAALLLTGHHAQTPAVLDHSRTLPQGDGRAGPAFTRRAVGSECNLIVLDAGDVFHDAFAVRGPGIDAESEVRSDF